MPKQLRIFPEKCIGCKSCELACALVNEKEINPSKARITMIFFREGTYPLPYNFPHTCKQCADAPCMESCPVGALIRTKDSMKRVVVDYELCTNCGICVRACPFGAMYFDRENKLPFKCELCDGEPACVSVCPSEALVFVQQRPFRAQAQALQMEGCALLRKKNRENLKPVKAEQ
jgi:Fe-S-cluster-containing dehydrogenase component